MNKYELNAVAKALLAPVIIGAAMFLVVGTSDWTWAWIYNGLHVALWIFNTVAIVAGNRELLAERGRRHAETPRWDSVLVGSFALAWLVVLALASIDARFGWTTAFPIALRVLGALLLVLGYMLLTWAMVVNRHFEPGVRVQHERAHRVVSRGPYRFVRHPGYTGTITAYFLGTPLLLGSWPALIPAAVGTVLLVVRTAKEDAFLRRELDGYEPYAKTVRYRLLPPIY